MFPDDGTQKCYFCNNFCTVCAYNANNCSVCDVSGTYKSYLKDGTTCVVDCGTYYYENDYGGVGPNMCEPCDPTC